jgi:hypothetical protein
MAKKTEEEDDEKPWTPDQPLPDEDAEDMVQKQTMVERRKKHLLEQAEKKTTPAKKKTGWGLVG